MMTSCTVGRGDDQEVKYNGVRKRKWGKWVSEIRLPNSRERIWLGSYDSPEKAARAFDAATYCLRGRRARLNFPDNPPVIPTAGSLTHQQIQELAADHAHSAGTTATTRAVAAAAMEVQETTVENSPIEGVTDAVAAAATAVDWPFLDMLDGRYSVMDEFLYDFLQPTVGPTDGTGEEEGSGAGTSSDLWNFEGP